MFRCLKNKRGATRNWVGPRLFVFVLAAGLADRLCCQERPLPFSPSFSIGTDYFDVFRQRSNDIDINIFERRNFATFSVRNDNDSVGLSLAEQKDYAAYSNRPLRLNGTGEWKGEWLDCFWQRSEEFYRVGVSGNLLTHHSSLVPGFAVIVLLSPFGPALEGTASWQKRPQVIKATLAYQSDVLPIDEVYISSIQDFSVVARPFSDFTGTIRIQNIEADHHNSASGFSFFSRDRSFGVSAAAEYRPSTTSSIALEHEVDEKRISGALVNDGQTFGELSDVEINCQNWRLDLETTLWTTPTQISYSYGRTTGSTAGHGESWPFSDFVTSVVANRMIFKFDGQYDVHTFTVSPEFKVRGAEVAIDASFLHIDTQAGLTHWEPLFLVFGIQNYEVDDLTLEWIRMARLGVTISIPILAMHLGFHFEQYVPLALHYAPEQIGGEPASGQPSVTRNSSTDGGRRFGITLSF